MFKYFNWTLLCTYNLRLKNTWIQKNRSPLSKIWICSSLRIVTKIEILINNNFWELIQTKFSKEVENKYNGDNKSWFGCW